MTTKSRDRDQELFKALSLSVDIREREWEMLFDRDNHLVSGAVQELDTKMEHPHPLERFYMEYADRLLDSRRDVFTPYDAGMPIIDAPEVCRIFQSLRMLKRLPMFKLAGPRSHYRLDPRSETVGVLTAGGSAPGLNTILDSVVKRHSLLATKATELRNGIGSPAGLTIWGYEGGYSGLVNNRKRKLDVQQTDRISLAPGCLLGLAQGNTPERRAKEGFSIEQVQSDIAREMADAVKRDKLDILYVIGGDGTITGAYHLCKVLYDVNGEHGLPVRVVAAPKTMDNDVQFTDITFGFGTTVENAVKVIQRMHLEAETSGRVAIVELFGAGSGFVALHAAYASGEADYVLIPELMRGDPGRCRVEVDRAIKRLADCFNRKGHAILVVAEGATAASTQALKGFTQLAHGAKQQAFDELVGYISCGIKELCPRGTAPAVFASQPQHLICTTAPNVDDVDLCKQTGKLLVDTALAGMSQCVVSLWRNRFVLVPMSLATMAANRLNMARYYFLSMMESYLCSV